MNVKQALKQSLITGTFLDMQLGVYCTAEAQPSRFRTVYFSRVVVGSFFDKIEQCKHCINHVAATKRHSQQQTLVPLQTKPVLKPQLFMRTIVISRKKTLAHVQTRRKSNSNHNQRLGMQFSGLVHLSYALTRE